MILELVDADDELLFVVVKLSNYVEGLLYFLVFLVEGGGDAVDFGLHELEVLE